jgi:hypothetical protein
MRKHLGLVAFVLGGLFVFTATPAYADRTPGLRSAGMRNDGGRPDQSVPYLITGHSAFMNRYSGVYIYSSPIVNDLNNPQAKPVFNLIYYGSRVGFGSRSQGATPWPIAPYPNR